MDVITHAATGTLNAAVLPTPSRWWGAAGAAFGVLPDLDFALILMDKLAFLQHHRGLTHSLAAMPVLALLGAGLGAMLGGRRWFRPLFWLGLAALASHLLLDLLNSYGTQLFSPFSRQRLALDWLFIVDPYLTGILLMGMVAGFGVQRRARPIAVSTLTIAAAYILLCGLYHRQALFLARQTLQPTPLSEAAVAALPQPFSCRRWHLIAALPDEIRQTFMKLPVLACLGFETS